MTVAVGYKKMLHFDHHIFLRVKMLLFEPKGFPSSLRELEGGLVVLQTFSNDKTNGYGAGVCR